MGLLEREDQLGSLSSWFGEADDEGRLAFVSGEAGSGKSALVTEFCAGLPGDVPIHWGACEPLSVPRPLGPLVDMASTLDARIPELLVGGDRHGVFAVTLEALGCGPSARVVVVEDAHWADEATLDLLQFLARRIRSLRVLVVVTFRAERLGPLGALLGDVVSLGLVRRLSTPPLSLGAVRRLAADSGLDAVKLHRDTGGNALFVTEVLRQGSHHIPVSVRDAVLAQVGRLAPAVRRALEVAAVVGTRVEPGVALAMDEVISPELDECVTAGFLLPEGRDLVFRHELARQAILDAIPPGRRASLHAAALQAMRVLGPEPGHLSRMAEHAEEAGDITAVLELAPAAAVAAARLGAHREAAFQYARALRYAVVLAGDERATLLERYANECDLIERPDDAIKAWREAISISELAGDTRRAGDVRCRLACGLINAGRREESEQAANLAVEMLEPLGPGPELAMAYAEQCGLSMLEDDAPATLSWGRKAIAMAEEFGNNLALARALDAVGVVSSMQGDPNGEAMLKRALEISVAEGLDDEAAYCFNNLGCLQLVRLDLAAMRSYNEAGLDYCEDHDVFSAETSMRTGLAEACFWSGDWTRAADLAKATLERNSISRANALVVLGRVRARRRDPDVWPLLDEAAQLAARGGELQYLAVVAAARAEARWLSGSTERVAGEVRDAFDLAVSRGNPWSMGELGWWLWRVGELTSAPDRALRPFALQIGGDWAAAAREWTEHGFPYEAAMALADSRHESDLRAAADAFDRLGALPAREFARLQLRRIGAAVPRGPRHTTRRNPAQLTGRELEVLTMVERGLTDAEIAKAMYVSTRTVNHHVSSILAKLEVGSRGEAARKATQLLPLRTEEV